MKLTNYIKDHVQLLDGEITVNHEECSAGKDIKRRLWMKRVDNGVICYCHNCGEKLFIKTGYKGSLFDGIQIGKIYMDEEPNMSSSTLSISDFTQKISKEGLLWLFKYDITLEEIEEFKIGYSPRMNRLILPVYKDSKLVYWQGRALEAAQRPKYLNPRGVQPICFNRSTTDSEERSGTIVVVEDIISAIKVGRVVDCYAMLGSKFSTSLWDRAVRSKQITMWLDKDKEDESKQLAHHLRLYTSAYWTVTDQDPKDYSTDEIKKILGVSY